jgi:hypothetical protein
MSWRPHCVLIVGSVAARANCSTLKKIRFYLAADRKVLKKGLTSFSRKKTRKKTKAEYAAAARHGRK